MFLAPRYGPELDDREVAVIKCVVGSTIASTSWLSPNDFDDLMQEAVLKWLDTRSRHRTDRGANRNTYCSRIVRNHLLDRARREGAQKRGAGQRPASLDTPPAADDDGQTLAAVQRARDDASQGPAAVHRREDLAAALTTLSERQLAIVELLKEEYTMREIAEGLGIGRSTVQDEITRLRSGPAGERLREIYEEYRTG